MAELQWKLKTQAKLLGKIFGLMFPTFFGCQTTAELARVRVWDKNLPGKLLGALPKRKWVRHLQRVGQELLVTLWRHVEEQESRHPQSLAMDLGGLMTASSRNLVSSLGLVGTWWSGQEHRVRLGIDGLLLVVVIGDGQTGHPGGLHRAPPRPGGARSALPRQADVAAGHAGSDLGRLAAAGLGGCQPLWSSPIAGLATRS